MDGMTLIRIMYLFYFQIFISCGFDSDLRSRVLRRHTPLHRDFGYLCEGTILAQGFKNRVPTRIDITENYAAILYL